MQKALQKALALLVLALLTLAVAQVPNEIGSLYQRDTSGSLNFTCTASIVSGADFNLDFEEAILTAAHCVEDGIEFDDATEEYYSKQDYFVTFNETDFYSVHPYRVGEPDRGYDVAVLRFVSESPTDVTPIRIGHWGLVELGTTIESFANPAGLGLQRFEGYVSMLRLERQVEGASINWRGYAVGILPGAGGSSGSLVLSSGRVIGVHVGSINPRNGARFSVFFPASRFEAFLTNDVIGRPVRDIE